MSRPKTEINPIPGQRLKQIIDEQGISQSELSRKIHLSQQTISRMIKGLASVTDQTADYVIKIFPQYRKSWLMGYDEMKTGAESLAGAFQQNQTENELLMRGLISFAKLSDIEIGFTSPAFQNPDDPHHDSIENILKWVKDGYTISSEGRSAQLTLDEMNVLQNEICDFVEFKLKKIIDRQNRTPVTHTWKSKDGHIVEEE